MGPSEERLLVKAVTARVSAENSRDESHRVHSATRKEVTSAKIIGVVF